ncbi:hypothetical protein [Enterobacter roggenkampii]|uniref:hypothetical protein n=1 Tax=Enterobacter cloacae complex TaxID=354276 RepID=UPI002DB9A122|nr:hypothetical protein [Enterobacter roggenkampii]MEB6621589.1 hypothetical protein [Enterobacter roggenkampii]
MHIILNSLRYALWLVFCLFRHAVFVPAALGGVCLLAWLVFGHPVSDLNDQLQKEATAWRTAPPGHYMWEECPVPDNAAQPEVKQADCTVTAVSTETAVHNYLLSLRAVWFIFFILSNVLYVLWRLLADALHYHCLPRREASAGKGAYIRMADGKVIKEAGDE